MCVCIHQDTYLFEPGKIQMQTWNDSRLWVELQVLLVFTIYINDMCVETKQPNISIKLPSDDVQLYTGCYSYY